jgi:peptidoglycan/xylan/chitin deacetylase (PgdA/CDA1 family)
MNLCVRAQCRLALLALTCALAGCGSGSGGSASVTARSHGSASAPQSREPTVRRVEVLRLPANPVPRTVRVPILTYHRVHLYATELTKSIPDETVEPETFAAEMRALARAGFHTISQTQLFRAMFDGAPLPSKPVLITVDDGYVDDVTNILPVLKRYHMVATFYIITGRFHEPGFVNRREVLELDDAGMDIGAHTVSHVPLNAVPTSEMVRQIVDSKRALQRILGHFVYFFAYPYGAYDAAVVDEVRKAGFVLAVTTKGGTVESSQAPLTMPRIHVGRGATASTVLACAQSGGCGGGGE